MVTRRLASLSPPYKAAPRPGHEDSERKRLRTRVSLYRLARVRHRCSEATIDGKRLTVDVGRLVAGEKERHRRNLVRLARALQRVELPDLVGCAALFGAVEHRLGHAGLDQAGTYRVDAYAGAGQRVGGDLHQADDAGLARTIGVTAGARLQARHRCGADDRAGTLPGHVGNRMLHR